jgi:hypothetical protein
MYKKNLFLMFLITGMLSSAALSVTTNWTGWASDDWGNSLNWSTGLKPTSSDRAYVAGPDMSCVIYSGTAECEGLFLGNTGSNSVLTLKDGATLNIIGPAFRSAPNGTYGSGTFIQEGGTCQQLVASMQWGQKGYSDVYQEGGYAFYEHCLLGQYRGPVVADVNGVGIYYMNGGTHEGTTLTLGREGTGKYIMTGGTANLGQVRFAEKAGSDGHLQLDGGTMTVATWVMNLLGDASCDITGGTLILSPDNSGSLATSISNYIGLGKITGYSGRSSVNVDWDGNKTTVTAAVADHNDAWNPVPVDRAGIDWQTITTLSWLAGDNADGHRVYFGDDEAAVEAATTGSTGIYRGVQVAGDEDYVVPEVLVKEGTYYWRIDEVKGADVNSPDTIWKGTVWEFTINDFITIDDFESYDSTSLLIEGTWIPSGDDAPGIELSTTDHTGDLAMNLSFSNDGGQTSYVEKTYDTAEDWVAADVKSLAIWWRGDAGNSDLGWYVKVADASNASFVKNYDGTGSLTTETYEEWRIDLADFSGVDLSAVKKIAIGMNGPCTGDELYIDDIRLYDTRCLNYPAADLNGDCKVDFLDFAMMSDEWMDNNLWP